MNKYRQVRIFLMTFLTICILSTDITAQSKFNLVEGSTIQVAGTSSLHDWEMVSSDMKSQAEFELDDNGYPIHLKSLTFSLGVKSLSSDNRRLDNNAYDALKASTHSEISFRSVSSEIIRNSGNKHIIKVRGMLTIAGVTKTLTLEAACEKGANNSLICSGETKLKMTEFDITPPTFMLGSMKVGDEVTISYKMIYKQ